uniref:Uncharacterized protein n=1 Tax=Arundo donax TaxID=35708 RepID=A0A0A8ZQM1_ARUDO
MTTTPPPLHDEPPRTELHVLGSDGLASVHSSSILSSSCCSNGLISTNRMQQQQYQMG